MTKIFHRTTLIFLGIFAASLVAVWGYHYFYVWPGERCEAAGRWWAASERICGVPVRISDLTGRPDPVRAPAAPPAAAVPATPAPAPAPVATPPASPAP